MDPIEIFRTGTHTDSAGKIREWTDKDLEEIAALYNPEINEAPIVIGHPEHDSPAYGWVESLQVEGGKLLAKVKDVADEFKDWVRKGLYKKVSIALYPDLGLRHVGFLGATPPAVKGLKQAAFGDKKAAWDIEIDIEALEPDLSAVPNSTVAPSFTGGEKPSRLNRDATLTKGGKKMDVTKFFADLKALVMGEEKEIVPTDMDTRHGHAYTEADLAAAEKRGKDAQAAAMFAETEKLKKEKADAEAKVREIEVQKQKDGVASFCEAQCKEGKLTPALRSIIEPIMIAVSNPTQPPLNLRGGEEGLIEFAEGVKKTALEGIKDFLTELPKVVTFKEVTPKEGPGSGGSAGEKLAVLTKKKMEEQKISWSQAFSEVQKENIELAREYQTEISPKQ